VKTTTGAIIFFVDSPPPITRLLRSWGEGDEGALERLTPLIGDELRRIAGRYMRRERPGNTLQPTALVNEAWLHLLAGGPVDWHDRAHFFAVASRTMRRILVDAARTRAAGKHRGRMLHFQLNESIDAAPSRSRELLALDDALYRLAAFDPRKARIVEMRFFGGLTAEETAAVLRISPQTVLRDWKLARAWLKREAGAGA
jgi:RNA polymerase sigma-70 factor, ECF subfamily